MLKETPCLGRVFCFESGLFNGFGGNIQIGKLKDVFLVTMGKFHGFY
jgi:hypothetical protein